MAEVRVLDAEPLGKEVIKVLQEALAQAERGELSSVAIASVKRDGSPDWHWSFAPNNSLLIGVIERMKADLIRSADGD